MLLIVALERGEKIKGDPTYERYLKSVTKNDIRSVAQVGYGIKEISGSKLEMLIQIKDK